MKSLVMMGFLVVGTLLAGATEWTARNLNFSAGLKDWQNAYPKVMTAEALPGGVRLTVTAPNAAPGALVQSPVRGTAGAELEFSAKVDCATPGIAYLHIKVNKGGKQVRIYDSLFNAKGVSHLSVRFHTGDGDSISLLCRMKATAESVGRNAVFSELTLRELKGPKLLLAGDSTVASYAANSPTVGWGQVLAGTLKPEADVVNLATSGRSTKSFIAEKRWETLLSRVNPGDVVLIQFGHNDQKKENPAVYAAADGAFQENLKRFITEVRARQGAVILCTPVSRRLQDEAGKVKPTLGDYPEAVRKVGRDTGTPVIDLTAYTAELYEKLGVAESRKLFNGVVNAKGQEDYTHYGRSGAELVASEVARQIKNRLLPGAALVK